MADDKETLKFDIHSNVVNEANRMTKALNELANGVMSVSNSFDKLSSKDQQTVANLKTKLQTLKDTQKVMQQLTSLTKGTTSLNYQEVALGTQFINDFGTADKRNRDKMMQELRKETSAQQKIIKQAFENEIRHLAVEGKDSQVKVYQEYARQLKDTIKHNTLTSHMTPKQLKAYDQAAEYDKTAAKQRMQNAIDQHKLINRAKTTGTLFTKGSPLSSLPLSELSGYQRAGQTHLQQLRLDGGSSNAIRKARQELKDLEARTQQLKDIERETRLSEQRLLRQQKAIASGDSRAVSGLADQYETQQTLKRGNYTYKLTGHDSEGLRNLRAEIKSREKILKLAQAAAKLDNSPTNQRKVKREKDRIENLRQMEESLRRQVALENDQKFSLNPTTMAIRSDMSRRQNHDRMWGDGGAALFRNQAGMLGNYALMGAGIGATYMGVNFVLELDKAFRQLQAILALTNGEMVSLSDHLVDVSEKTKFTALEVVDAATTMGQAGFSTDEIRDSIESVTLLATAIGTDLKSAVDLQTSVMGVYNKSADQMTDVTDKIVTAINTSKLNLEKLTLGMQYSGNVSSQLGVTFEENMAALAAMANSGIRSGSTLGTGMRQVYIAMQKPSGQFLTWLDEVGLTMDDIDVKTRGLYNVLETLRGAGFDMSKATSMWETRAASAVGAIFNNMSKFKEMMSDFDSSMGAAAAANETQMQATLNQLDRLGSIMGTLIAEGAEPLRKAFTDIVMVTADMLSALRESEGLLKAMVTLTSGWALGRGAGFIFSLGSNLLGLGGKRSGKKGGGGPKSDAAEIAGYLAPLLSRAGPYGMVGAGALAIGSSVYHSYHNEQDQLDKAKSQLSENIRLYDKQQAAIRKLTTTLYEMDARQKLYTEDQDSLIRFTQNLNNEFGSLGLMLGDVEGDFGKTRQALVDFRAGLIASNPNEFPDQSFNAVLKGYAGQRKKDKLDDSYQVSAIAAAQMMGDAYKTKSGTHVQPTVYRGIQKFNTSEIYADMRPKLRQGLALFTENDEGVAPINQVSTTNLNENLELVKTLTDAMNVLSRMKNDDLISPTNTGFQSLYKSMQSHLTLTNQVIATLRREENMTNDALFDGFSAKIQTTYGYLDKDIQTRRFNMKEANPILTEPNAEDKVLQAQTRVAVYEPLLEDAKDALELVKESIKEAGYEERSSDISLVLNLEKTITELSTILGTAKSELTEYTQYQASEREKNVKNEIQINRARLGQVDTIEALNKVSEDHVKLLEKRRDLELNQHGDDVKGQFNKRLINERFTTDRDAWLERVGVQKLALNRKAASQATRLDRGFNHLQQGTLSQEVKTLEAELQSSVSTEQAKKLGDEIKALLAEKMSLMVEDFLVQLKIDPESPQALSVRGLYDKQLVEQHSRVDLKVSNKQAQIEKGIFRQDEKAMLNALSVESSFLSNYMGGQGRLAQDKKRNTLGQMSNIYKLMKSEDVTDEGLYHLKEQLDSLINAYFEEETKLIELHEKDPESRKQRLKELDTAWEVAREKNQLSVDAAYRVRENRIAAKNNGVENDLLARRRSEWQIENQKLKESKSSRQTSFTEVEKNALTQQGVLRELQNIFDGDALPDVTISIFGDRIKESIKKETAILTQGYQGTVTSASEDIAHLQDLKASNQAQLTAGGLSTKMSDFVKKEIATIDTKIAELQATIAQAQLASDTLDSDTKKKLQNIDQTVEKRVNNGRYSGDFAARKAQIWETNVVGADGTKAGIDGGKAIEGQVSAWQAATNAAKMYGDELSGMYKGYDALTDATLQLADATDKAIQKAASLASEVVMGAKDGEEAWRAMGEFVLQMLVQIAMQVAVSQLASAFTPSATGGPVRRSVGGTVPKTSANRHGQDSVHMLLMPEEYVIRSSVARNWGDEGMNAINTGQITPEDLNPTMVAPSQQTGFSEVNVWVVNDAKDAGNGGIQANDVVAIVGDNITRRGHLRQLIQSIKA